MKDIAAIVEPALDIAQLARATAKEHIALQDCDRQLESVERKSEGLRQEQSRRRVEIGRLLIEAKRGIKHGGWLPYLEKLRIGPDSATRWMALAGYVESQVKNRTDVDVRNLNDTPTLADAGIDKRPRKRDEEPDPIPPSAPRSQPLDIDRELSRLNMKIVAFAEGVPVKARKQIAHELREIALLVEEMQ